MLRHPAARAAFSIAGFALLALAVWSVAREHQATADAWAAARAASPWLVAALLVAPLLSWVLTGVMFHVLTARFGAVSRGEMLALIGATWLLNYAPMRPGLVGRVAYLKAVRGISIRSSIRVGVEGAACTLTSALVVAGVALAARLAGLAGPGQLAVLAGLGLVAAALFALGVVTMPRLASVRGRGAAALTAAFALRLVDMLLLAARLWGAHHLIGKAIEPAAAAWLAGPAQIAGLLPVQVGVQEWAIGLFSSALATGVAAAIVNRAADLAVCVPVGSCSLLWLWRTGWRGRGGQPSDSTPSTAGGRVPRGPA